MLMTGLSGFSQYNAIRRGITPLPKAGDLQLAEQFTSNFKGWKPLLFLLNTEL